MMAMVDVDKVS